MRVLAVGELLGDKLRRVPNRTAIGPLLARALSGSLIAIATRPRRRRGGLLIAASLGAAAAIASSLALFHARRLANRWLGGSALSNAATGAAEDALALAAGHALLH